MQIATEQFALQIVYTSENDALPLSYNSTANTPSLPFKGICIATSGAPIFYCLTPVDNLELIVLSFIEGKCFTAAMCMHVSILPVVDRTLIQLTDG